MKLAVSNIAWTNEEEKDIAALLRDLGVKYIEIAPTKTWEEPVNATNEQVRAYLAFWSSYGIEVVAFQSMLFTHPEMRIFEDDTNRQQTLTYLKQFTELAGRMGAGVLVFGSPKNRQKGDMPLAKAEEIARDFFAEVGEAAQLNATNFCIEPNPEDYACDFVTNAQEGIDFVRSVNNSGFGLHLDIAGMTLAGDDVVASIKNAAPLLRHFHISAPQLSQVEDRADVDYHGSAQALKGIDYQGYVSIEMRPDTPGTNAERVEKAVRFAQKVYSS